jgi:transposase, IS30 family
MSHHHLTRDQRSELGAFMVAGLSQVDISLELGVHPSTICGELKRCPTNNTTGYNARAAAVLTRERRARAISLRRKLLNDMPLRRYVTAKLKLDWSPEQISGRLAMQHGRPVLSHETIYAWVYRSAPRLKSHLRHGGSKFRHRRGTNKRWQEREKLRRRWIDDRPEVVALRTRVGDWGGRHHGRHRQEKSSAYLYRQKAWV